MKILLSLIFLILFIIWSILFKKNNLINIDKKVYNKMPIKEPFITFFKIITNLADTKFFIIICCLLFLLKVDKSLIISCILLIGALIIFIFKHLFKRKRPEIRRLVKENGYSYPSGHMFSGLCFYGFLIFLIISSPLILSLKLLITIFLLSIIFIIGFSRIFLGVHYFSDVIASLFLASCYLLLSLEILEILNFIWVF